MAIPGPGIAAIHHAFHSRPHPRPTRRLPCARRLRCSSLPFRWPWPACGPSVRPATYLPQPQQHVETDPAAMRIYEHTRPDCDFEEIGRVTGRRGSPFNSMDQIANAMRRRAAQMGGDAIIEFAERNEGPSGVIVPISDNASYGVISAGSVYVGTVVRFTDPECAYAAPAQTDA
jgi:hypothetical protein